MNAKFLETGSQTLPGLSIVVPVLNEVENIAPLIAEIRSAYKRMMLQHHPDRVPPEQREAATRKAAEINDAYDLLIGRGTKSGMGSSESSREPPPNRPQTPKQQRPPICENCQRRHAENARFCGHCGVKLESAT